MNAYWDEVRPYVVGGVVRRDDLDPGNREAWAIGMRQRYSWTITDPATVEFVREQLGGPSQDPFAASGWWSYILRERARLVWAFDAQPPAHPWRFVDQMDALHSIAVALRLSLLLSWPPRHDDISERIVHAYRGSRIVHVGAEGRTSDGTDEMRHILRTEWTQVAQHVPVRWPGVKDLVIVYERLVAA